MNKTRFQFWWERSGRSLGLNKDKARIVWMASKDDTENKNRNNRNQKKPVLLNWRSK